MERTLIKGTQLFGKTYAFIDAIAVTIIGIIMILSGIVLIQKKSVFTGRVTGTVMSSVKGNILIVEYGVKGKKYKNQIKVGKNTHYKPGDSIQIMYNPKDPRQIRVYTYFTSHRTGWIMIILSIVIGSFAWINVWFTRHSPVVAGLEGVSDIGQFLFTPREQT